MKKTVLLFTLVLGQFCFSQEPIIDKGKDLLIMEGELVPYVEYFLKESAERSSLTRDELIDAVRYIKFNSALGSTKGDFRIGGFSKKSNSIHLSNYLRTRPLLLRLTLFHEIGHAIKGEDHTCKQCSSIMSSTSPKSLSDLIDDDKWEEAMDEYFEWLDN